MPRELGNASGSITKLAGAKGASWKVRLYLGTKDGKKQYATRTFKSESEAKKWARQGAKGVTAPVQKGHTIEELCAQYVDVHGPYWAPKYRTSIRAAVKVLCESMGTKPVAQLTTADLDRHYADCMNGKLRSWSSASTALHKGIISKVLTYAVELGWASINASLKTKHRKVAGEGDSIDPPEPEEIVAFLNSVSPRQGLGGHAAHELTMIVMLCSSTGMRVGEICGLQWRDLKLTGQPEVTVARSITRDDQAKTIIAKSTKTARVRSLSLGSQTAEMLTQWRKACIAYALKSGATFDGVNGYVFSPHASHTVSHSPSSMCNRVQRARERAGLGDNFTLRQLRHYHATQLLGAGFDPVLVANRLGHAQPSITLNVYAHRMPKRDQAAASAIEAVTLGAALG